MKNQSNLNTYFSTEWKGNIEQYKYSGPALIGKIALEEYVLDVGCGDNYFKGKIKHLVGIDPANNAADVKMPIESFTTVVRFNVAFCLGSINFGTDDNIERQIAKVVSLLTPRARIYWRCNPGQQDHGTDGCKKINFYPWSIEKQIYYADKFGFKIFELRWDEGVSTNHRIYAEWVR